MQASPLRKGAIYVDLGTENTLVYAQGRGLVLNEPSFLSYRRSNGRRHLEALGKRSKEMLGREPAGLEVVRPLREGVIADLDSTALMLREFLEAAGTQSWVRPDTAVISLPCKTTDQEAQAVREAGRVLGARRVLLADEPVLAALGAGLPVESPEASMIVDIGGGTTEIAIVSLSGIVYATAARIGGHEMDERIVDHLRSRFNFSIGEPTAERLKIRALDLDAPSGSVVDVKGLDLVSGLPRRISIERAELASAVEPVVRGIVDAIRFALSEAPPEVASDLADNGLVLAGGVARLAGLSERISRETGVRTQVSKDPLLSVAAGGAKLLNKPGLLERLAR